MKKIIILMSLVVFALKSSDNNKPISLNDDQKIQLLFFIKELRNWIEYENILYQITVTQEEFDLPLSASVENQEKFDLPGSPKGHNRNHSHVRMIQDRVNTSYAKVIKIFNALQSRRLRKIANKQMKWSLFVKIWHAGKLIRIRSHKNKIGQRQLLRRELEASAYSITGSIENKDLIPFELQR